MKHDIDTKEKLLKSAKREFLEKGYNKASLRIICRNAGVTTGALYFFFNDKEDIFKNIVGKVLSEFMDIIKEHFNYEKENIHNLHKPEYNDLTKDIKVSKSLLHFMYKYKDEFTILLTKSQGSCYENIISDMADFMDMHYRKLADYITEKNKQKKIDNYMIHWMSHMQIDAFINLFIHESNEEKAMIQIENVSNCVIAAWNRMFS